MQTQWEKLSASRRPSETFEGAADQIAKQIKGGEYGIGDRLPSERDLAAKLKVGGPTLREAVRVLEDAGVIELRKGSSGGLFVVSDRVPLEQVHSRSESRLGEIAAFLEARRLLEPWVAQLAAAHAREEDFAAMEEAIELHRRLAADSDGQDRERVWEVDLQFHALLARATRNSTVIRLMEELFQSLYAASEVPDLGAHPEWGIEIHERTLQAIRSGDRRRIDCVMDEHLASTEALWERATGKSLAAAVPSFLLPV